MSSIGGSTSANAMAASRQVRPKSIEVRAPQFVFPGLGPGIHERLLVDGRAKPGQYAGSGDSIWPECPARQLKNGSGLSPGRRFGVAPSGSAQRAAFAGDEFGKGVLGLGVLEF